MSRYITVLRGRQHEWRCEVSEAAVEDMRADGIEVFEVYNTIPAWVAGLGLTRVWCAVQDLWDWPSRAWRKRK